VYLDIVVCLRFFNTISKGLLDHGGRCMNSTTQTFRSPSQGP